MTFHSLLREFHLVRTQESVHCLMMLGAHETFPLVFNIPFTLKYVVALRAAHQCGGKRVMAQLRHDIHKTKVLSDSHENSGWNKYRLVVYHDSYKHCHIRCHSQGPL